MNRDWAWLKRDPVRRHAEVRPHRTAIVELATGRSVTFAELDREIGRAAGWLEAHVAPSGRIAFLGRNSLSQVLLYYGCQRAGRVFVPLNWRLSGAELAVLLEDCAPDVFVHDDEFAREAEAGLAASPVKRVIGSADFAAALTAASPSDAVIADPFAPAALLYTSGTTGKPKGVILTAKWMYASAQNFVHISELSADSIMLCDTPLFHTVGLKAALAGSMVAGATFLMSDRFVPGVTLGRLADKALGVTHSFCVPQMAQAMMAEPSFEAADLSHIKALFSGGAPLPRPITEAFLEKGVVLANGYGMTEAGSTLCMPLDAAVIAAKMDSAGLPSPTVMLRLVGPDGADVKDGEVGEVWLSGPSLMPGYWNQPEATAKALTADGWLKTGDAARRDEDGFIFIVDRWKDMYITGGENVYPAEVEAVLIAALEAPEIAVVGVPDARWGETGVAFVASAALTEAAVLAACDGRLARYKHPRHVRFIEALPRTASGKIQKDVLRRLFAAETESVN
ncbi:MAG: AMP-binding protein [Caulobacteraceae bacterium]